ncbi:MAG: CBS domain-containing protein [Candidatus Solibacter usitatus]|nr:CBS domain-containing protein [Candidatus Solibacter usitatus]
MAQRLLYLTELIGLRVYDLKGQTIGRVKEAAVVPLSHPFRIDRFLIGAGATWFTVRHDQVGDIALGGITLSSEELTPFHSDEYMLRMVRDLQDQQIIDAHGRKVVRVNDVTFEIRRSDGGAELLVEEVDIGLRSIFRRLLQGVIPPVWIRRLQWRIPPHSIRWEYCNIIEPDPMRRLRLNISPTALEQMHPADLAEIMEELAPEGREAVITSIDSESAAEALSEVDPEIQASILESLETEKAAEILDEMSPDEAADVLQEMEEETSEEILEEMSSEEKLEVEELLIYGEHTAGGMMNTEYVAVPHGCTVAEAIEAVRSTPELPDSLSTIFLIGKEEVLTGQVLLAKLLRAQPHDKVASLADEQLVSVFVEATESRVTESFDKYNLLALPVVDHNAKLLGVITADDVIAVLRENS